MPLASRSTLVRFGKIIGRKGRDMKDCLGDLIGHGFTNYDFYWIELQLTSNLYEIWLDSEEKEKQKWVKVKSPTTGGVWSLYLWW